ncbi:unnamed protein product [Lathyrus sativus]|nr:unnamed protein product [Lathyrus sativus]
MGHEQSSVEKFEKFTWKVQNFSSLNKCEVSSEPFILGGFPWLIYLYPKGEEGEEDFSSIYLGTVKTTNMSEGWSRDVKFKLLLFNQLNANKTVTIESRYEFNARQDSWGFKSFITLDELHDSENGFIVKDSCIFGAEVYVCKSAHEKPVNQSTNISTASLRPKLEEGELMDFECLGQMEKKFAPLLDLACYMHPSLIVCQQKRSRKFREWAFSALGRVIYFLQTKKVRDMNDIACKHLQIYWEELEHFGFDLTWLEPHVQSALSMKSYLNKLKEAEKLKDNVVALELEMQRLKAKMVIARDLLEAQKLEEEIDLDAELGFVKL